MIFQVDSLTIHFFFLNKEGTTISDLMINEQIRDKEVRLIGVNGEQLGIMSARDAMRIAREAELDLVKIAPTAKPPVCKIIDYGKFKYEQARKEKEARKKQKTIEIKEVRLSPNIEENDLNTKVSAARKFIQKGDKVKVTLRFRGREMAHVQKMKQILDVFAEKLSDIAVVEKAPKLEGRQMMMFLTAVSYTHLDVYKRQDFQAAGREMQPGLQDEVNGLKQAVEQARRAVSSAFAGRGGAYE